MLNFLISTGKADPVTCPPAEVKNLSLKGLICLISPLGRGSEQLWGLCLGGDEDEPPPQQLTVVNPSVSMMELIAVAVSVVAVIKASLVKSWHASFSSERAILYRRSSRKRIPPACCTPIVADDIRAMLPILNCPVLQSKMAAVPVEEQRRERKLSWCFLTAEVSSNEAVAIADLVGGSFGLFGDEGCTAVVAKE